MIKHIKTGRKWISELDICVLSSSLVDKVVNFSVIHNDLLPSDHAPITVEILLAEVDLENYLLGQASLGNM